MLESSTASVATRCLMQSRYINQNFRHYNYIPSPQDVAFKNTAGTSDTYKQIKINRHKFSLQLRENIVKNKLDKLNEMG